MNFSDAGKIRDTISASDEVRQRRGLNRAKINDAANGAPPLSAEEAQKANMHVNENFLEMGRLFAEARRQFFNGFYKNSVFFNISIPDAPENKSASWGKFITNKINKVLRKSRGYFELHQNKFAGVVAHGIGPQIWYSEDAWLAKFVAIEDLVVPTDTTIDFDNLEWFAVWKQYTPGELARKVFGEYSVKGWKKKIVAQILAEYKDENSTNQEYDWITQPEKIFEIWKQNMGYWTSDAVPSIPLYHFYFREKIGKKEGWMMRVVTDLGVKGDQHADDFIFDNGNKFEFDNLDEFLHVQFGDLNNKPPFMYHSVRSLGFLLYGPCFWENMLRCRAVQHTMESFNAWFKVNDPAGKARAQKIEMYDKAILPEGVSLVPQAERHQVDVELLNSMQSQFRQLMAEASATYTQQLDSGTQKEQTATETMAKLQSVTAMMSGILGKAFIYASYEYQEICRRFCKPNSEDKDVQKFQKNCQRFGIPKQYLDHDLWNIEPAIPLGGGNPTIGLLRAQQLLQMRPMFDGEAQLEILHDATVEITDDPQKADRWVKLGKNPDASDASVMAGQAYGTLMQGVQPPMKRGLNVHDQIKTLFQLVGQELQKAAQNGNMMTAEKLQGLQNVMQYIGSLIKPLEQDKAQQEKAKEYMTIYGQIENLLKGFAQRLQQQAKAAAQKPPDPEAQAKAQAIIQQTQAKIASTAAITKQKLQIKDATAKADQRRKTAGFIQEQTRKTLAVAGEQHRKNAATSGDMNRKRATNSFDDDE